MTKPGRNAPCPCGSGKKYKLCHLGKPDDPAAPVAPAVLGPVKETPPSSWPLKVAPDDALDMDVVDDDDDFDVKGFDLLDEAWEFVWEALELTGAKRRAKHASKALEVSADCVGAYVLQGVAEKDARKRVALFSQALDAAARVFRPIPLAKLSLLDWDDENAEYAYYATLYRGISELSAGHVNEAIEDFSFMASAHPEDPLQASILCALAYLRIGELEEAHKRCQSSELLFGGPTLMFTGVLLQYLRFGDTIFSRRALAEAIMTFPDHFETLDQTMSAKIRAPFPTWNDLLESIKRSDTDGYDPIVEPIAMFALEMLIAFWTSTDGAHEWLRRVHDAGPAGRYDNELLGTGPLLKVLPAKEAGFRQCPSCQRSTKVIRESMVLLINPGETIVVSLSGRRCHECDIDLFDVGDMYQRIVKHDPALYGIDFIPLGYLYDHDLDARPHDFGLEQWVIANMKPWRKIEWTDSNIVEWPAIELVAQRVKEMLSEMGLLDEFKLMLEQSGVDFAS